MLCLPCRPLSASPCPALAASSAAQRHRQGLPSTLLCQAWPSPAAQPCCWHLTPLQPLLDWKYWWCVQHGIRASLIRTKMKYIHWLLAEKSVWPVSWVDGSWCLCVIFYFFSEITISHMPIAPHYAFFNVLHEMYIIVKYRLFHTELLPNLIFISWKCLSS